MIDHLSYLSYSSYLSASEAERTAAVEGLLS